MHWADSSGVDISQLANYGVLGIMFVFVVGALLSGHLVAGWVYRRLEKQLLTQTEELKQRMTDMETRYDKDLERERAEKIALRTRMDEQVIPLLSDTSHLLREALRTLGRDGRDGPGRGAGT